MTSAAVSARTTGQNARLRLLMAVRWEAAASSMRGSVTQGGGRFEGGGGGGEGEGGGGGAAAAGSTANPRPLRLRRASSSDVTGQARQIAARSQRGTLEKCSDPCTASRVRTGGQSGPRNSPRTKAAN